MYELVLMDSLYPHLIFEQSLHREDVLPFSTHRAALRLWHRHNKYSGQHTGRFCRLPRVVVCSRCSTGLAKCSQTSRMLVGATEPSHSLFDSCWWAGNKLQDLPKAWLLQCLRSAKAHTFWFALKAFDWHEWLGSTLQYFLCCRTTSITSIWYSLGFVSC